MSLMAKMKKNSKLKDTEVLTNSKIFTKVSCATDVPMLNVALSGSLDGGLVSGLTVLAGESKHFKTSFALKMAAAYLIKHPDGILMFYDTEFGSPQSYFESFGIDTDRVLHSPVRNIEELKFDLISQLETISRDDHVIIIIDSIGNSASKKELQDALDEKSVADMSRAKALKGLFRMITPYLTLNDIPMIAVNHIYKEIGLFPKNIVSGGTGIYYSSSTIWIIGRRQIKEGTEVTGYDFVINIEKSRFLREKVKIPITVSYDGGIEKYSGLLDTAMAGGFVVKPKIGWYQKVDTETGELVGKNFRKKDTDNAEFWDDILASDKFNDFIKESFQLNGTNVNVEIVPAGE